MRSVALLAQMVSLIRIYRNLFEKIIITSDLYIKFRSVCLSVRLQQPFSAPSRSTLANEVPNESSLPREGLDYIFMAV